jgi:predicted nucleotidyltransferase
VKEERSRLDELVRGLGEVLGDELVGVYLHGSLALGCFNPALSDVDVLMVTRRPLRSDRRDVLRTLFARVPRLELHSLSESDLTAWRHPAHYDLHYDTKQRLFGPGEDHDLAAHFVVVRHRGATLVGPGPADVFPEVPWEDYEDSLRRDLAWCREHGTEVYAVLSPARIWATLTDGSVHSKASGAAWALERAPAEFHPLLRQAHETYRTGDRQVEFAREEVSRFADFVATQLGERNERALESECDPPPEAGLAGREAH